jgi:hypothetical protein
MREGNNIKNNYPQCSLRVLALFYSYIMSCCKWQNLSSAPLSHEVTKLINPFQFQTSKAPVFTHYGACRAISQSFSHFLYHMQIFPIGHNMLANYKWWPHRVIYLICKLVAGFASASLALKSCRYCRDFLMTPYIKLKCSYYKWVCTAR